MGQDGDRRGRTGGVGFDWMGWDGMGWDGMGSDRMKWDGWDRVRRRGIEFEAMQGGKGLDRLSECVGCVGSAALWARAMRAQCTAGVAQRLAPRYTLHGLYQQGGDPPLCAVAHQQLPVLDKVTKLGSLLASSLYALRLLKVVHVLHVHLAELLDAATRKKRVSDWSVVRPRGKPEAEHIQQFAAAFRDPLDAREDLCQLQLGQDATTTQRADQAAHY